MRWDIKNREHPKAEMAVGVFPVSVIVICLTALCNCHTLFSSIPDFLLSYLIRVAVISNLSEPLRFVTKK